jgi:hypothetical protein
MREYRKRKDIILSSSEQEHLKKELFSRFQDKLRSTKVEMAIIELLEILRTDPAYNFITYVKHEPPIGPKNEKPDILLELFGNDFEKFKKIAFEVKVYTKGTEIPTSEVKKTHILLKSGKVHSIWWITNVPLSLEKYNLSRELEDHLGRTSDLSEVELAYIAFSVFFEEIFNRKPTSKEANELLKKMGIDIHYIRDYLLNLKDFTKKIMSSQTTLSFPVSKDLESPKFKPNQGSTPSQNIIELDDVALKKYIEPIIMEKSSKSFMAKKSIFTMLEKKYKIIIENDEDKMRIMKLGDEIASSKGFSVKNTRIYF